MNTDTISISPRTGLVDAIQHSLWYFQYFKHALSLEELHCFLGEKVSMAELEQKLNQEVSAGRVVEKEGFYALEEESLEERINHQKLNARWLKIARRMSKLIAAFPFVRAVYLSGSLSKEGLRGKDDDIDYFLITAAKRVWTAKFFLMAFKKVFLLNSKKYFCINLLRDERYLSFQRENIYIATEMVSILALQNPSYMPALFRANPWVYRYFPNADRPEALKPKSKPKLLERLLDRVLGDRFEEWCRKRFEEHVQRQKPKSASHFETSPQSSAYFPNSFQDQVLQHYNSKTSFS